MKFREIRGFRVQLVPLELGHIERLFDCSRDIGIWDQLPVKVTTLEQMEQFIRNALKNREMGDEFPYSIIDIESGEFVGMTRFYHCIKNWNSELERR